MSGNNRLDEIQARLDAATPGLWAIDKYDTSPFESIVSIANDYPGGWVEVARSVGDDAKFITNAPTDVAFLLAELRKAREALARVEALAADWTARGEHDMAFSKTVPDENISIVLLTEGASMVENARHIRNAIKGES